MVMVLVEPAEGSDFLGTLQLAAHHTIFPTVSRLQSQANCRATVVGWCGTGVVSG